MRIRAKQQPAKVSKIPEHRRASADERATDYVRRMMCVVVHARARDPRGKERGQQGKRREQAIEFKVQARPTEAEPSRRGAEAQGADQPKACEEKR